MADDIRHEIWMYSGMPTGAYTRKANAFILEDSTWNDDSAHTINPEQIEVQGDFFSAGADGVFFQISETTSIEIRPVKETIDEQEWFKFRVIKTVTTGETSEVDTIQEITLHLVENVMWAGIAIQAHYKTVLDARAIYGHVNGSIVVTESFDGAVIGAMNVGDCVVNYIGISAPYGIKAISATNNSDDIDVSNYEDFIFGQKEFEDLTTYNRIKIIFDNIVHPIEYEGYDYKCTSRAVNIDDPSSVEKTCTRTEQYKFGADGSEINFGSSLMYKNEVGGIGFAENGYGGETVESNIVTNFDTGASSQIILTNANGNKIKTKRIGFLDNYTLQFIDSHSEVIGSLYAEDRDETEAPIDGEITPVGEGDDVTNLTLFLAPSENIRYGDMNEFRLLIQRYFLSGVYPDASSQSAFASYTYVIYRNIAYLDAEATSWWLYGSIELEDPDEEDDDNNDEPDEGKPIDDEPIGDASTPSTSALDIGVISIFNPSSQQMQDLTQEMQNQSFLDEIAKYFKNSPLEGIMSCHVVPIDVATSGSDAPHFGNWTFETTMPKVSEQFYTVNFGSIKLEKKFASFLDYAPYTRVQVYLPYIGYREIDVDDAMGKNIGVKYNFDIVTGAILAQVNIDGSVHYQYSGSAIMQFPLTASNHNNLISSIVGLVTSGATTIAGLAVGGPAGAVSGAMAVGGAMSLASSAVHTVASSKPEIQHGGSFAMTNGFLSVKTPYLVVNRPNVKVPDDFAKYSGRMTNKTKYVSECSGYTEFASVDVNSLTALEDEKAEIETILKGGFYA